MAGPPLPPQGPPAYVAEELAGWQEMAQTWPLTFNLGDPYLRCGACDQAVLRLEDQHGRGYHYAPEPALTSMVAHIRQVHASRR